MVPQQDTSPKVPKLRFREFHDEWEENKIGEIFSNIGGTALESFVNENGEYKFISIGNYSIHGKYIDNNQRILLTDKTKTKLLEKDNLVMVLNDKTSTGDMIGSSILIDEDNKYIYNQRSERLICKPEIFSKYAWFFLNSEKFRKTIVSVSQGGTQMYVNFGEIKKLHLFISNISEQQKIALFLSVVNEKIEKLKAKKSLLEKYKKGIMQKIFSREIRFQDENGKEYSKWEEKELGELLDYEQPTNYLVKREEYNDSYKTPVLTAGKTFILGYTNETTGIFNKKLPVIIFDDFTTATQFVDFSFKAKSSAMKILIPKGANDIRFLYEVMQEIKYNVGGHGRHWISIFAKILISVPSIPEQQKIASFLSEIDKKINTITTEIESTEKWKKGLLQGMFI